MSASLRKTDEPSTWFRCLSTLGCAVAQLSGQTATDLRCQLELLEPHSLRQQPAVFYTCELASLPGCWLWSLFSAEAMLAHNVSPRTGTKERSRRCSCFVAVRLCFCLEGQGRSTLAFEHQAAVFKSSSGYFKLGETPPARGRLLLFIERCANLIGASCLFLSWSHFSACSCGV